MTPFNPTDKVQALFLSALSLGETAHRKDAQWLGVGNVDLSKRPCGRDGFPIWDGVRGGKGISHAAGVFQFEPGTWSDIAKRFSCHFGNLQEQYKAAWCLASEVFSHRVGVNLYDALKSKSFATVQRTLETTWPSVTGDGANPIGLAEYMARAADW